MHSELEQYVTNMEFMVNAEIYLTKTRIAPLVTRQNKVSYQRTESENEKNVTSGATPEIPSDHFKHT